MQQDPEILRVYCTILESSLIISQHKKRMPATGILLSNVIGVWRFEHPSDRRRAPQIHVASFFGDES